jgi:hypothetical protein
MRGMTKTVMKKTIKTIKPRGHKFIYEIDRNRMAASGISLGFRGARPKSRAIYAPNRKTLEKQKKKITLAKTTV